MQGYISDVDVTHYGFASRNLVAGLSTLLVESSLDLCVVGL